MKFTECTALRNYNEIQVQYTRTLLFYNDYNLLTLSNRGSRFSQIDNWCAFCHSCRCQFFVYSEPLLSSFRFKVTKYTQTTLLRSIYFFVPNIGHGEYKKCIVFCCSYKCKSTLVKNHIQKLHSATV